MALFREDTELEKLIKRIRNANISYSNSDYLEKYVNERKNNSLTNEFFEEDFLIQVIYKVLEVIENNDIDLEEYLNSVIKQKNIMFTEGKSSDNYEYLKDVFLNQYVGVNGILLDKYKNVFNDDLFIGYYNLFNDEKNVFKVIQTVKNIYPELDEEARENIELMYRYGLDISGFITSEESLRKHSISFITALSKNLYGSSKEDFYNKRIGLIQKASGIYDFDESLLDQLLEAKTSLDEGRQAVKNMLTEVEGYEGKVKLLTNNGLNKLSEKLESCLSIINKQPATVEQRIDQKVKEVKEELQKYLDVLEANLKDRNDNIFIQKLNEAKNALEEYELTAKLIAETTDKSIGRISTEADEKIAQLRDLATNDRRINIAVETAGKNQDVKEGLIALKTALETGKELTPSTVSIDPKQDINGYIKQKEAELEAKRPSLNQAPHIIIPSEERIVIPANKEIEIPDFESPYIRALDPTIPYRERLEEIERELKRRKANGELFHKKTMQLVECIMQNDWPYIWGPSGVGKSWTIEQACELIGLKCLENGRITEDLFDILGYYDAQGRFMATQAYVALKYGYALFLDEMDSGNPVNEISFNSMYSQSLKLKRNPNKKCFVKFATDKNTQVHPNFRLISAGNTNGEGETAVFNGRFAIDGAVQQRMTPIKYDYDNELEKAIFKKYPEWYKFFCDFREACDEYARDNGYETAPGMITTRDASDIVGYLDDKAKFVDWIIDEKFTQTKNDEYLGQIEEYFREKYKLSYGETSVSEEDNSYRNYDKIKVKTLAKSLINDIERKRHSK